MPEKGKMRQEKEKAKIKVKMRGEKRPPTPTKWEVGSKKKKSAFLDETPPY